MNLTLIETFAALMRTGSTTRAAALLGISQPAVSRSLRRLEDTTKLRLFVRSGPRLDPTPEAHLLYREILDAHVGMDRLRQAVVRMREVGTGSIKIASSAAIGLNFLPKVIGAFARTRPDVLVTFEIASSSVVRNLVSSGQFDIGFCADEIDLSQLQVEPFGTTPGVCVMRTGDPLAVLPVVGPGDLDGCPFVGLAPEDTVRRRLTRLLDAAGSKPRLVAETPYSATVCELVRNGLGVGIANSLSYASGNFDAHGLTARPFTPSIPFRSLLILPPQRARSLLVEEFIRLARSHVTDPAFFETRTGR